jgi:dsDNA-binding SOS-regulon protein
MMLKTPQKAQPRKPAPCVKCQKVMFPRSQREVIDELEVLLAKSKVVREQHDNETYDMWLIQNRDALLDANTSVRSGLAFLIGNLKRKCPSCISAELEHERKAKCSTAATPS